ncbi:nnp-1 protein putative nuclear protein 1 nop52 [Anaeramoeba flamelloides]|uniref:Nnp-1 protein putative nuclear protein 1 nop52 n=1 Tax=Anaeramoeba flamelloides TaxID=1746091 RepID=A0AAV7YMQ4_9EUKA|nr:nnp-1 protein putative nuclear protein 1 nop52 [Anaeramoeba flamelloides]
MLRQNSQQSLFPNILFAYNKNNSVYLTPTIENNKKPIQTRRRAYTLRTTKRENSKTDGYNSNFSSRLQRLRNKKKEMEKKIKLENSFIKNNQQKDYSDSFTSPNFLLGTNSNHNSNKSTTTTTRNTTTKNTTPYSNLTTTTTKKPKTDWNSPNNKIQTFNQNKNMRNNKNDNSNYYHNTSKRNQNTKNSNLKKKGFKLQKYSSDVSEEQKNTIEELLTLALLDLETTESNQQEVHKQKDIDKVDESEIMEQKPISKHKLEENLLLHNTINENNINKNYNVKIKNAFHQKIQMNNNLYNNQKNKNNKFKNNNIIENTNNRKFSSNNNNNNNNNNDDDNLNDENNKNEKIQIEKNTKENDYKNEISNEIPDQSLKDTNSTKKGSKLNKTNKPIKNKRKNVPQFSMSQDQFEILNFYNTFKISKFQKQIKQIHKNNVFKKAYSEQNKNQTNNNNDNNNNNNNNNNLKNYKIISQSKRENILLKSEFKTMFRNLLKKSKKQEHIKVIFSSERFYLGNLKEYFENGMLVSKVKPNGKLQQRMLYLSKDGKSLCWNDQKKKGKHVSIPFAKIEKIFLGRKTQNMKKVKKNINHNLCFSLVDSKNIFDFISVNIHIHKFWMKCLTAIKDNAKNVIDSFNI